ncbi:hypothetical protein GCM10023231_03230 [Olivibacter ginsenosidimutans]|uniref:Uncharacterized protein n=1 Tax=Olivibacter ginsenosidimutans TaxID=1176537 RepID=A0ABP9AEM3_9SPHI
MLKFFPSISSLPDPLPTKKDRPFMADMGDLPLSLMLSISVSGCVGDGVVLLQAIEKKIMQQKKKNRLLRLAL